MTIELLDISHWQTIDDWQKMVDANIDGIYIKFTQSTNYKDPKALQHYENAKKVGLKVGAYHFVTKENGIKQYENFMESISNLKFELTPMLDCEAYRSLSNADNLEELRFAMGVGFVTEVEKEYPVLELRYGNINEAEAYKMGELLGYSYPTEAIVDVIARRLVGFQGFPVPAIYTNPASGNVIFKSPSMKKYLLWIAHWGVQKPRLPKVWQGQDYYMWQDGVYPGKKYGVVDNKVDHNFWGKKVAFPGDNPPPPPPVGEMYIVAYPKEGKYEGSINKT